MMNEGNSPVWVTMTYASIRRHQIHEKWGTQSMKTALLVIDMQNDYLWEKRKPIFAYNTERLVAAVNELIHEYHDKLHSEVVYIRHIIQNLPTNRLLFGYSIAGTEGAELYSGLDIVSEYCYDKYVGDALTNKALRELIAKEGIERLDLCGLDECGCVTATALGAVRRGIKAEILQRGTETVLPEGKVMKAYEKLRRTGVELV